MINHAFGCPIAKWDAFEMQYYCYLLQLDARNYALTALSFKFVRHDT